jgi:hypothetical protein
VVTKLGQEGRRQELADAGEGIEEEGIGMLGEEVSQRREGFHSALNLGQEKLGQDADLVTMGYHGDGVGLRGRIHQVGISAGDEGWSGIAMFPTESLKSRERQGLGFLGRGEGHEEVEADVGGEFAGETQGLGIDTKEDGAELVALALNGAAQQIDEPYLSQDLLGERGVGLQATVAVEVGVEDAGQQGSIRVIGMGAAAAQAIAVASCGLRRDQVDDVATVE